MKTYTSVAGHLRDANRILTKQIERVEKLEQVMEKAKVVVSRWRMSNEDPLLDPMSNLIRALEQTKETKT